MASAIIVSVCVGHGRAYDPVDFEYLIGSDMPKGVVKVPFYITLNQMMSYLFKRLEFGTNLLFPKLIEYSFMPWEGAFRRNIIRVRDKI